MTRDEVDNLFINLINEADRTYTDKDTIEYTFIKENLYHSLLYHLWDMEEATE